MEGVGERWEGEEKGDEVEYSEKGGGGRESGIEKKFWEGGDGVECREKKEKEEMEGRGGERREG